MYECICGNISEVDYKCCELCGSDEWIKNESYQEKETIRIGFKNDSTAKTIKSNNSVRSKRAEYFKKINEYIDNLPDKEFDDLLIGCGIEKCPYDDISKSPIQSILIALIENKATLEQAELRIKELIIDKIDNHYTLNWAFDKNESFLAGMDECEKIIKNL